MSITLFSCAWAVVVYLFHSAVSRKFRVIRVRDLLLYMSTFALLGIYGEVFCDTIYNLLIGHPLWIYHFMPVHNGYTSTYSIFIWGLYGFYLYLFHSHLASVRPFRNHTLAMIICCEAIILEILLNCSFLYFFKDYYFYYYPSDMWHVTTLQAIPFYYLAGRAFLRCIKNCKRTPWFFIGMNIVLVSILVFFV